MEIAWEKGSAKTCKIVENLQRRYRYAKQRAGFLGQRHTKPTLASGD
jgi:hypothetical protein